MRIYNLENVSKTKREERVATLFERIPSKNCPKLIEDSKPQIQKPLQTQNNTK